MSCNCNGNHEHSTMTLAQAGAVLDAVNIGIVASMTIRYPYPPTQLPPDGSSYAVISCYVQAGFKYLAQVTDCQTIEDPALGALCVSTAVNAYNLALIECDGLQA